MYLTFILKKIPLDIHEPCINIANSEILFEQYRMALNQEKDDSEVRNDDTIKSKKIFFNLMQRTFNRLYGLRLREI